MVLHIIEGRRLKALKIEYEAQGKLVLTNRQFNSGVDILVINKETGKIEKVIESTNYQKKVYYIGDKKRKRYIGELSKFPKCTEKELVVSFPENLIDKGVDHTSDFEKKGIKVIVRSPD